MKILKTKGYKILNSHEETAYTQHDFMTHATMDEPIGV